jgi:hypothetical protein
MTESSSNVSGLGILANTTTISLSNVSGLNTSLNDNVKMVHEK